MSFREIKKPFSAENGTKTKFIWRHVLMFFLSDTVNNSISCTSRIVCLVIMECVLFFKQETSFSTFCQRKSDSLYRQHIIYTTTVFPGATEDCDCIPTTSRWNIQFEWDTDSARGHSHIVTALTSQFSTSGNLTTNWRCHHGCVEQRN